MLLFALSCKKDKENLDQPSLNQAVLFRDGDIDPMTTTKVHVENGMLKFDDYPTFKKLYYSLKDLSVDKVYVNAVSEEPAYKADPRDEFSGVEYPVLAKYEDRFGFVSLRKSEELRLDAFFNTGGQPENFKKHFIPDPTMKTLLNPQGEVMIGKHIFKHLNPFMTAIITDGDLSKLNYVRNTPLVELQNGVNLYIQNWLMPKPTENPIFIFENDSSEPVDFRDACTAKFRVDFSGLPANTVTPPGFVSFRLINESTSIDPNKSYNYKWYYSYPGNQVTVLNTSDFSAPVVFTVKISDFPITAVLKITGDCTSLSGETLTFCGSNFSIVTANGREVTFTPSVVPLGSTLSYSWNFGDGSTLTTSTPMVTHFYATGLVTDYTVSLTVTNTTNNCTSTSTSVVAAGCGAIRYADKTRVSDIGSTRMEVNVNSITLPALYRTYISSTTTCFKRNIVGNWKKRKADTMATGLIGYYYRNCGGTLGSFFYSTGGFPSGGTITGTNKKCLYLPADVSTGLDITWDDGMITSTHTMTEGTTTFPLMTLVLNNQ
jgi:PKD repeat protein